MPFIAWLMLLSLAAPGPPGDAPTAPVDSPGAKAKLGRGLHFLKRESPRRVVVSDAAGRWRATFTVGARTVAVAGPQRRFAEPEGTPATVSHGVWVRVLPTSFAGAVDEAWLAEALISKRPDVLQVAMEYVAGAPPVRDRAGLQIAGDADYGPLKPNGNAREEGADFNDYLGISWTYPGKVDPPEARQRRCLDCSGFVRMVYGYRSGLSLTLDSDQTHHTIPRRAVQIDTAGPGVQLIPDRSRQVTDFAPIQPGDLVFFDADPDDGPAIDHVGIYLGIDDQSHHRFLSSRKSINGPTLGDVRGKSILDGNGLYAKSFRSARRF